jgi:hypothetical protein
MDPLAASKPFLLAFQRRQPQALRPSRGESFRQGAAQKPLLAQARLKL